MEETEKFSLSQIRVMKHIRKKGFAGFHRVDGKAAYPELDKLVDDGYLTSWYQAMFKEDVYQLTDKGQDLLDSLAD